MTPELREILPIVAAIVIWICLYIDIRFTR